MHERVRLRAGYRGDQGVAHEWHDGSGRQRQGASSIKGIHLYLIEMWSCVSGMDHAWDTCHTVKSGGCKDRQASEKSKAHAPAPVPASIHKPGAHLKSQGSEDIRARAYLPQPPPCDHILQVPGQPLTNPCILSRTRQQQHTEPLPGQGACQRKHHVHVRGVVWRGGGGEEEGGGRLQGGNGCIRTQGFREMEPYPAV